MSDKEQSSQKLEFSLEATVALIHIIREKDIQAQLLNKGLKKGHVWEEVSDKLKEKGYDFGIDGPRICNQKYRNLKKAYITHIKKPGGISVPYISELETTFSSAKELLEQQQSQDQDGDSEEDSDDLLQQCDSPNQQLVQLSDVLTIIQQFDKERQRRDREKNEREDERMDRLENLLRDQNELVKELTAAVTELTRTVARKRKRENDEN